MKQHNYNNPVKLTKVQCSVTEISLPRQQAQSRGNSLALGLQRGVTVSPQCMRPLGCRLVRVNVPLWHPSILRFLVANDPKRKILENPFRHISRRHGFTCCFGENRPLGSWQNVALLGGQKNLGCAGLEPHILPTTVFFIVFYIHFLMYM